MKKNLRRTFNGPKRNVYVLYHYYCYWSHAVGAERGTRAKQTDVRSGDGRQQSARVIYILQ